MLVATLVMTLVKLFINFNCLTDLNCAPYLAIYKMIDNKKCSYYVINFFSLTYCNATLN